jgi:hypothetical protein
VRYGATRPKEGRRVSRLKLDQEDEIERKRAQRIVAGRPIEQKESGLTDIAQPELIPVLELKQYR